jgi:cadmium resistance protein CadD (predicted permease)
MMENQDRARVTMFLALLALAGIAVKFLIIAALHFLRPETNPVLEPISNYGVGPYGFLLTVADIGSGLATLALAVGLYFGVARPGRSYVGLFLLALYGVSELLSGIFPIDVGAEATTAGTIHNIVGNISFFCFPIAAILLSLRMGKDEQWRSLRRPALGLSIVVVLTVILTIAGANLGIWFGMAQRLANVAVMVWIFVVALHLRSVAQGALAQQPSRVS